MKLNSMSLMETTSLEKNLHNWFVYILRCADNSLYTGLTNDLDQRLEKHNLGKGAKYTRSRLPVEIVYSEKLASKSDALKRECQIKKMKRAEKMQLILEFY